MPLYYLGMIWHLPNRTTLSREEFATRLEMMTSREEWIIVGNYIHTMPLRLWSCDTVFFFDLPTEVCLAGAEEHVGRERGDILIL